MQLELISYIALLAKAVYRAVPGFPHKNISSYQTIVDPRTDTQVTLFSCIQEKKLYIVVRGSESKRDWINNFMSWKVQWHGIRAHKGYSRCAEAVWGQIREHINRYPDYQIVLSGHSLGGAVATLLAVRVCQHFREVCRRDEITLLTFGQRKCSRRKELARQLVACRYVRVSNGSDVAPRTPYVGYSHAGTHLYLPNSNRMVGLILDPPWYQQWLDRALTFFDRAHDHSMTEYIMRLESVKTSLP